MHRFRSLLILACAVCAAALVGCGSPPQTEEEAKSDQEIQQQAPELQEGA